MELNILEKLKDKPTDGDSRFCIKETPNLAHQFPIHSLSAHFMGRTLASLLLLLAIVGGSDAIWCVCRTDVSSSALQKALDYACGAGADCSQILQNGACYNLNTVLAHCSYAANSYYQRKGQAQGTCDFAGTATITSTDPSVPGCTYPATPSTAGTGTTTPSTPPGTTPSTPPAMTTPSTPLAMTQPGFGTTTPTTPPGSTTSTTPSITPPDTFTANSGTGGLSGALGPLGNSLPTDASDGGLLSHAVMGSLHLTFFFSYLVFLHG